MARRRHLPNAPISEALLDFRVSPRKGLTLDVLKQVLEPPDFGYYVKGPIAEGTFSVSIPGGGQAPKIAASSAQEMGFRLHSSDEKYVAQWQIQGFTLSRLPPYESWDTLLREFKRLWAIYRERTQPTSIARVATRFINNLRLPLANGTSFQQFLVKFGDVPPEAPQAMEAFHQRFQLVDRDSEARVLVSLALDPIVGTAPAQVILDVDAVILRDMAVDDGRLWSTLDQLHDLKNRVFFGSITEEAARLYE